MDDDALGPHERREHLISWASRRGGGAFGWYAFEPPRWFPGNATAQWLLASVVAVGVKTRYAIAPPKPAAAAEEDVDPALVDEILGDVSRRLPLRLAPRGARGGSLYVGMAGDLTPEQESALAFVQARGVEVDPAYWQASFSLRPAVHLAWAPDFGGFSTVDGLVGRGFAAYVRVLHPVRRDVSSSGVRAGAHQRFSWADLPDARLDEPGWRPDRLPDGSIDHDADVYVGGDLDEGFIPAPERAVIAEFLCEDLAQRQDGSRVVQGLWEGFNLNLEAATACRIEQPGRAIVPFVGPLTELVLFDDDRTPSIVYPESGAWCLANDTDLVSTYLGCDEDLAAVFLADPRLECRRVRPGDRIG